jgi:hypothetical protein
MSRPEIACHLKLLRMKKKERKKRIEPPYGEYQKLVEANNNGGENDFACDRANISELYLVGDLLSAINDHIVRSLKHRVNGI